MQAFKDLVAATEKKKQQAEKEKQKLRNGGVRPDPVYDEALERKINTDFWNAAKALASSPQKKKKKTV